MGSLLTCLLLCQLTGQGPQRLCVQDIVVPGYPRLARIAQLEGSVSLELRIGEDGTVLSAEGSGAHPLLVQEAEKNIREWTFAMFPQSTEFPISHRIVFTYRLQGKPEYREPIPRVVLHLPDRVEIISRPSEVQPQGIPRVEGPHL